MAGQDDHVDAAVAAGALGISRASLYAYVSRGLIRTRADEADPRRKFYSLADIETLQRRKAIARSPGEAAATTLDWGLPVLASAITRIAADGLFYRGRDAVRLAENATLEECARLLWDCGERDPFAEAGSLPEPWEPAVLARLAALPLVERCQALLPQVGAGQAVRWQRPTARLWPGAAALLRAVAAAASRGQPGERPVHSYLAEQWGCDTRGADAIRRALVLLADHELNASAFAVRVVASTGASLGACLNAGLGALSGPLHGGMTSLVELLFDEMTRSSDVGQLVEARLRRGEGIPGFGHPLYPEGDPRAAAILKHVPADPHRDAFVAAVGDATGKRPSVDFALVALRRSCGLPEGAALAIFAIGRTAGWIAHALEQGNDERLIRPRARYIGVDPV
ncbi:citrate synthase [Pseudohoeflea suaedae]|uniref:citrate synthase (unknown stereospecificity) n=1 Tax=Pseudohoeflea suaedae TaxID=877384 RepID=A0A4R5PKB2_9HYPH|nr:citrate synthase [Pseudohoeflea suaedae]TDH36066.1 citrate synthase [Pseudohoeflea suaedae]